MKKVEHTAVREEVATTEDEEFFGNWKEMGYESSDEVLTDAVALWRSLEKEGLMKTKTQVRRIISSPRLWLLGYLH